MCLLLLFLSQGGYHLFYTIRQYEIEEEMKHRLLSSVPERLLEVVDEATNKHNIEWEEEGREFYLHGQLYDVAYIKVVNGRTLIYCLNDVKEEKLLSDLAKITGNQADQNNGNPSGSHTVKFHSPDLILFAQAGTLPEQTTEQKYFVHSTKLISVTTDILTPPPDQKQKNKTGIL